MAVGLDQADKIASVVGASVALIALIVTLRSARRQPPAHPSPHLGHPDGGPPRARGRGTTPVALIVGLAVAVFCAASSWGVIHAAMRFVDDGDGGISAGKPTSPSTSSSGTPSSAGPAAAPVLWKGEIRLDSTPRDFDQEPPARGNTSTDLNSDGYLNGSVYNKFWGRAVVLWPGPAEPTRDGCAARLQTHGVKQVTIDSRSRVCLETNQGRIVFITVLRRDGDDGYAAQATLWSSS